MPNALEKLLTVQLVRHAKVHLDSDLPRIRIVDSVQTRGKNISRASNDVLVIAAKLAIYAGSCGVIARGGILDLNQAGMILLVRSSSGLAFHIELSGTGKHLAVTRVSTGAIAKDLEKAIQRTKTRPAKRGKGLQLRVLRVAAMHLSAVWVHHPKKHSADVFVPYTPNFADLWLGRAYKLHRIQSLLKQYATQMILRWYDRYEKNSTEGGLPNQYDVPPAGSLNQGIKPDRDRQHLSKKDPPLHQSSESISEED